MLNSIKVLKHLLAPGARRCTDTHNHSFTHQVVKTPPPKKTKNKNKTNKNHQEKFKNYWCLNEVLDGPQICNGCCLGCSLPKLASEMQFAVDPNEASASQKNKRKNVIILILCKWTNKVFWILFSVSTFF